MFRHFNISISRLSRGFVLLSDFSLKEVSMDENDEDKYIGFYLNELMHGNPILRFGTLFKQVCEATGVTQSLLEKYGQAEYAQLEKAGFITPDDPVSSMLQEVVFASCCFRRCQRVRGQACPAPRSERRRGRRKRQ